MPAPELPNTISTSRASKPVKTPGSRSMVKKAGRLLRGDFLARSVLWRELPYILLIAILGTLYIGNAYRAEKKMAEIRRLQEKAKEMYTRYISLKSELMFTLTRSELENALADEGIRQITHPPRVIRYKPHATPTPLY
ncbi:MAG: FtsL-like putative cell division protein [Flavobacteriales bacterium]|nr:FtsL-like putative cell division protein [Flavobacteriales bacterium]MCX7649963.1 FtsL-like putative cell division protein [Flavobacteriales bacterium]MDW8432322.1 FtsL-like putative cell division protein [Flavobacteriales bacterium]